MQRLTLMVISLMLFAGCREPNFQSCDRPENAGKGPCPPSPDASVDAETETPCQSSNECTMNPDLGVCDKAQNGGTCVHCTAEEHGACTLTAPRCENHMCVGCVSDADCGDRGVCLPGGSCAAAASIIHAKTTGASSGECGAIGNECSLIRAFEVLASDKNVVRLDDPAPAIYSVPGFTLMTKPFEVTIDARNAIVQGTEDGAIVTVSGMGQPITVLGGIVRGATGDSSEAILCTGKAPLTMIQTVIADNAALGINANDCVLTLTRAEIRGSAALGLDVRNGSIIASRSLFSANKGGAISINNAKFAMVGNAIFSNGDASSQKEAVLITTAFDASNRFDFNTIAFNTADTLVNAVRCQAGKSPADVQFTGRYNVISGNTPSTPQLGGNCQYSFSAGGLEILGTQLDAGNNVSGDSMLTMDGSFPHLMPGSAEVQKAPTNADLTGLAERDIDGDLRFSPADLGADQASRP